MNSNQALLSSILAIHFSLSLGWAPSAFCQPQNVEIKVTLLGQPCSLKGPYPQSTLQNVHSIGPAQVYPSLSFSEKQNNLSNLKQALEKVKTASGIPASFDLYREKLARRLEAQLSFFESLDQASRTSTSASLVQMGKKYLKGRHLAAFNNQLQKLVPYLKLPYKNSDELEPLYESFESGIQPDPEQDFHRTLKKLKIEYICSFEETD